MIDYFHTNNRYFILKNPLQNFSPVRQQLNGLYQFVSKYWLLSVLDLLQVSFFIKKI